MAPFALVCGVIDPALFERAKGAVLRALCERIGDGRIDDGGASARLASSA
jgi:hypothetical protein